MSPMLAAAQAPHAPQPLCIPHLLEERAEHTPDALAIVAPGRPPLPYGHLWRHIVEVVRTLHTMGVGRHDRVALALPNGPEMAVAFLAVTAGATCAPLNPAYSANECDLYLADLDVKALMVQAGMDLPSRAVAQARCLPIIELSPRFEAEAGLFTLTSKAPTCAASHEFAQPDDVALVLPTSGTMSRPKMVPLTHTNICAAAYNMHVFLRLAAYDRCLNVLPLFHIYGLVGMILTSLVAGASVVCTPGFHASSFFAWMAEFHPTWYAGVPTIHQELLAHATRHHEIIARCPLRFIRSGGAVLSPQVMAELERVFNTPVIESYGMTEASAQITCNPLPPRPRKSGSVGVAASPEVAIMDEVGTILPRGVTGEIVIRGASVMQGYDHNPVANRQAFSHGWFRTGDQGFLDADGYLFFTGRLKEFINRGGEKIALQEVDGVLMDHSAVVQAVSFAVPHVRLGEDIAAAVVLRQHATETASDIRQFVAMRLAAFKVPRQVFIVEDIPKSSTGKLQRIGLAEKLGLTAPERTWTTRHSGYTAPRTPIEEVLAGLWSQVLAVEYIGIHDNFFQLGGDSILATQLMSRVRQVTHSEVAFLSFFETPTVAGMARSLEAARQAGPGLPVPPLHPVPRGGALSLSYAQQRLWFIEQLEPSRAVYNNLPLAWRFSGDLNVPALEQSLHEMVQRHEILRTAFPFVDGQPVQMIVPELALLLPVVDLQSLPATAREAAVERLATEEARRPFDLVHGPLVHATLLRLSGADHVLIMTLHHMIFDGWSTEVFWRELTTLYTAIDTGQPISLPALPIQYVDFAVWQRQWLQGAVLAAQLAYWKQQLGDTLPVLDLSTDRPRPPVQTFQGARQALVLPTSLTAALKMLSQQAGVTLFMTLVAAFQTLLCRYTGQTDLVIGTPLAGRTRVETEGLLGFFVNTLILRTDLSGNPRFRELLRRVRAVTVGAYDHQDLPFEKLVEALQPVRDLSRNPLVQVMVALQPSPPPTTELPGLTVRPISVDCGTAKFELTLSLQDTAQGLRATVEYNTDLFNPATIVQMLSHFHTLLESIVADPEQRLADVPLLTAAERQQLLVAWNNTTTDYAQDTCLHELFEVQVERVPNAVAVVCGAQRLTYRALNRRANQLAHYLRALGVGPEVCIGLCVERSLEMVIGLLGILKAGGAYVPLDPTCPAERLTSMVADAQVAVLVTQQCSAELPELGAHVVRLDADWKRIAQQSEDNPVSGMKPENLAYVMYTSGSTGKPKGVMVEHRQVLAFLHGFEHVAPGGEECIGTAVCPFGFDVSVWECFSMLCLGGTLHILLPEIVTDPEHFVGYLVDHCVTSAYIPAALLSDVARQLEQQRDQTTLNRILVGVEPINQGILRRLRDFSEHMRIVNGYGPTETTICATLFPFRSVTGPDRRTPIGTGVRGYEVYLLDANMQPVPIGITSELYIGGVGVARGYMHLPELTAEKFIPHSFSDVPGARLYKTGDLARYLPDGNLEFLGRGDQQVKIRGYRVELEEIEAALRQHPAVREVVVLAREDERLGDKRLVAYLVGNQEPAPAPRVLRLFLKQKLPEYMVPSVFVVLGVLPLTPNGKIDRQALLIPDPPHSSCAVTFVAPRTPAQSTLAGIWAEVLRLERVSIYDNFFELGGDSIRSMQIVARANRAGLRLTPKLLFQHQTIAELSAVAGTVPAVQAEQGLVTGPVPLTPIQHWFFEQDLPDLHHWNQTLLLEVQHKLDWSVLESVVQHLLVHHDMLRARFRREAYGWWQDIASPGEVSLVVWVDLSTLSEAQQGVAIAEAAAQLQASLDLVQGPLVRLAVFDRAPPKSARLLVVIHHLVVDSVSWRILLEDLQMAYQQLSSGRAIQLPPKTTSFKHWVERLTAYAQSAGLQQELPYWLVEPRVQGGRLPADYPGGANTVASACTVSVSLNNKETHALLQEVPKAYQTQINDVLLTALVQAFAHWTGVPTLLVDLEGHGREEIMEGVDLSRTVGWFTTIIPVRLQLDPAATPADALKSVKEQLRSIPKRGIGYGVLRYLSQDAGVTEKLRALPQAEVCFNYLGQADQGLPGSMLSGPVREASGPHRSLRGSRRYPLEINGRLAGGQLQLDWTYSECMHRRDTLERLAQSFIEALRTLIVHCQSPEAGGYTPSDFPKMRLGQQELDALLTALDDPAEGN